MQTELDIVRDVSQRLDRAGIAYMLTGSMAMNYYAQPRLTRDIDLVVALAPSDADKVVDLFRPDYYVSAEAVRDSILSESIFNLIHNESVIKVDCIVRKNTPYRHAEFDRRQQIKIDSSESLREAGNPAFSTWIASKEDLIISKLFWAKDSRSEMQMRDVQNLMATGCDTSYIEYWTRELGLFNLWQEMMR
jgi:hypothetical protein